MSEKPKRGRYVPVDVNVAFKRFGTKLQDKWGMEGLCAWMLMLAAAKREPQQGTFTYTSEVEAWTKLGATATKFSFNEFITFCGRNKQTRRTASGRISYVEITGWEEWNNEWHREQDAQRKSRKRAHFKPDIDPTPPGHSADKDQTESEAETEVECEAEPRNGSADFRIPEGLERLMKAMTDRDDLTVKRLSSMCEKHRFAQGDFIAAAEAAEGPGVRSPSAVALAELKKRAERKAA